MDPETVPNPPAALIGANGLLDKREASLFLCGEDAALVRELLLVGLAAYGEVQRQSSEFDVRDLIEKLPRELRAIDVSGDARTVSRFATALAMFM